MGLWTHLKQKPTGEDLKKALERTTPEIIAPDLKILFCGINPGLYSAATGHNFARPGNRFWKVLERAGFTPRRFHPSEERELLTLGYGITNFCQRTTAKASELTDAELVEGGKQLVKRVKKYQPKFLAVLGVTAYRTAFGKPKAKLGLQEETIGDTKVWILPSPSGLNAHYQLPDLIELFSELQQQF
jgi:TDG/mug DNA glycosylase family protein